MHISAVLTEAQTRNFRGIFGEQTIAAIEALLSQKGGKTVIKCQVRAKDVQAKPEEVVRQLWLYRLLHHYNYPLKRLAIEYPITLGRDTSKRADIGV